ncbi:MAG: hypothetical protein VX519_09295 [Myxococcota bacterium]|nr:hypothetical protein [Myxococcota bacterium]
MQHYRAVLAMGAVILPFSACKSSSDQWNLQLFPHVAENQLPFESADTFRIVLERNNDEEEVYEFDAAETVQLEGADALDNTPIRVDILEGDTVIATGRTAPLTQDDGNQEVGILVANTESVAFLSELENGIQASTLTSLGNGRFLSTGGLNMLGMLRDGEARDEIRWLELGTVDPEQAPSFTDIGTMPPYVTEAGESRTGRHAHTATVLSAPAELEGHVLVAGGTNTLMETPGVTASAFIVDPSTGEATKIDEEDDLRDPRMGHLAVANSNGDVIFFGGWTYDEDPLVLAPAQTMEVFVPTERRFRRGKLRDVRLAGRYGYGFAASIPTVGIVHCGGVVSTQDGGWRSVNDCVLIDLGLTVEAIEPLPLPLAHASMIALPNRQLLVTGGLEVSTSQPDDEAVLANKKAYLYDHDTNTWTEAGQMKRGRNRHQSALLPDGRVLIIGGRSAGLGFDEHNSADFEDCLEIYDPATDPIDPFVLLDGCSQSTGNGQALSEAASNPAVVNDPDFGVLMVGGLGNNGSSKAVNLWVSAAP